MTLITASDWSKPNELNLFPHKEFCDVQVKCGDKSFDCHQFMLSGMLLVSCDNCLLLLVHFLIARSPVFRAMFQNDMAERKNKKVDVVDLHPDVVAEMLQV